MTLSSDRLYTPQFFQVFAAAIVFMTGVSLQFHFGQYVAYRGHGVDVLGRILSLSMIGTLLIRLHIGRWIDRFGCKPVWLTGALIVSVAVGVMQFVSEAVPLVVLRMIAWMATAAVMTSVAVFAGLVATPARRAESIGTLGLGGFLGMVIGATLGDVIFAAEADSIAPYRVFFTASAACGVSAALIIAGIRLPNRFGAGEPAGVATTADRPTHAAAPRSPSPWSVMIRHWPGMILLVAVVFHMVFCLQSSFLERLADDRGFREIKLFFLVYAPTAIILRLGFRRLPEQIGRVPTVVMGLLFVCVGLVFLAHAHTRIDLVAPGVLMGAGHCFVFPSMVDLAADSYPHELRGTGTSVILGAGDLGLLIGFLTLGELIDARGYTSALYALAGVVLGVAATFALTVMRRNRVFARQSPPPS